MDRRGEAVASKAGRQRRGSSSSYAVVCLVTYASPLFSALSLSLSLGCLLCVVCPAANGMQANEGS